MSATVPFIALAVLMALSLGAKQLARLSPAEAASS